VAEFGGVVMVLCHWRRIWGSQSLLAKNLSMMYKFVNEDMRNSLTCLLHVECLSS
jgi:hypothetical protein